jgi:hypothetical protein
MITMIRAEGTAAAATADVAFLQAAADGDVGILQPATAAAGGGVGFLQAVAAAAAAARGGVPFLQTAAAAAAAAATVAFLQAATVWLLVWVKCKLLLPLWCSCHLQ